MNRYSLALFLIFLFLAGCNEAKLAAQRQPVITEIQLLQTENAVKASANEIEATHLALEANRIHLAETANALNAALLPTQTSVPSTIIIFTPSATPYPTEVPTTIPVPTPLIALPFSDNFDQGLRSEWEVLSANAVVTEGRLTTTGEQLFLALNETNLQDMIIEFDYTLKFFARDVILVVFGQELRLRVQRDGIIWEEFKNDQWKEVTRAEDDLGKSGRLRIEKIGNNYSIYNNGLAHSRVIYGTAVRGSLIIGIGNKDISLDNFSLRIP